MMSRSNRRSCLFGALLPLFLLTGLAIVGSSAPQTSKEWNWTEKNWQIVVNDLLPIKGDLGYHVTYRATQSLHASKGEKPEYYFRIGFDRSDKGYSVNNYIFAHVRIPDSNSIYDQIMDMHRKGSTLSGKQLESKIRIGSLDYTDKNCPAARKAFLEFQELKYGAPYINTEGLLRDPPLVEVMLDGPIYEFHIVGVTGQSDVTLYDESNPLVTWAMKTQRELAACVSEKAGSNNRP